MTTLIALATALRRNSSNEENIFGAEGEAARIRRDDATAGEPAEVLLPIEDMVEARLVLTKELIAQALKRSKDSEREISSSNDNQARSNPPQPISANGRHDRPRHNERTR